MAITTYRDLEVYNAAYKNALVIARLSRRFPQVEQVELARQLRRAARSVSANIVEGWAKRHSPVEFKRYLQVAIGSCHESRHWLDMSKDEGYVSDSEHETVTKENERIGVMLYRLWKNWRGTPPK